MVSYVTEASGQPRLSYVGHSMGTTALWIMTDLYPEFANARVDVAAALAPVARLSNMISPLRFLVPVSDQIEVRKRMCSQFHYDMNTIGCIDEGN